MSTPLERGAIPAQNCCIICRVIDEYVTRWRADADGLLFRDLPDPYGNLARELLAEISARPMGKTLSLVPQSQMIASVCNHF